MHWASRRRFLYISGVIAFLILIFSVPFFMWWYEPATCFDGIQNQGETVIDRGGPCKLLDARTLIPHSMLWARQFVARPGVHSAVAYVENPNQSAGVKEAPYRVRLYDDRNILVAEREDITPIMPGAITPIFASDLDSGERVAERAFFEFVAPLVWERLQDRSHFVKVSDKQIKDLDSAPQVSALVTNEDVVDYMDVQLVAVVFDTVGNAFAASRTIIPILETGKEYPVTFTWSEAFIRKVARVDILPVVEPAD